MCCFLRSMKSKVSLRIHSWMQRFFYPECCSERKWSLLTLKLRAVHPISITAQAQDEERRRERTDGGDGEDGDAGSSAQQDLIKTKNINDEKGVDPFRRKSRSQRCEYGKISL